ncbi:MAG: deoxyguanosinetriphosphate triphosphohydrolase family protein [Rhodothermaceae bacterium]
MIKNPLPKEICQERTRPRKEDIRGDYFRDQTAIIHSMPFRRLKHKTQVFFAPQNDHVCTRIEHVMHVASIAATICKGLMKHGWDLDPELAYAVGLGHDMGHPPFGHAGEKTLNKILGGGNSFVHEVNSYRIAEYLANNGKGLNLTYAVKDGIICHNGEKFEQELKPEQEKKDLDIITSRRYIANTYEGVIVRFSDKIAYLGRDIEDAIIAGFIKIKDVPEQVKKQLGSKNGEIINTLVEDVIKNSKDGDSIKFSDEKFEMLRALRNFNYKYIYGHQEIVDHDHYTTNVLKNLFDHFSTLFSKYGMETEQYLRSPLKVDRIFGNYIKNMDDFYKTEGYKPNRIVTDYISGMTDNYAVECMREIYIPQPIVFNKDV